MYDHFKPFRYTCDNFSVLDCIPDEAEQKQRYISMLSKNLSYSTHISEYMLPEVSKIIKNVGKKLVPDLTLDAFVFNCPEIQAFSFGGTSSSLIIGLSAPIVEICSESELQFVVGHEIGHFIFSHFLYPQPETARTQIEKLNILALYRSAEISADRIGFLASNSKEDSYRAIMKIATGLSDKHLRYDYQAFINQAKMLAHLGGSEVNMLLQHPPCSVRLKALMWLEMSDVYHKHLNQPNNAIITAKQMNDKIENEMQAVNGFKLATMNESEISNAFRWGVVALFISDGRLTKSEQSVLRETFGKSTAKKILSLLKSKGKDYILTKMRNALNNVKYLPNDKKRELFDELNRFASLSSGLENNLINEINKTLCLTSA